MESTVQYSGPWLKGEIVCDIMGRVVETDFVPGVPLDTVLGSFGTETKAYGKP
jgi:hypothetical protein